MKKRADGDPARGCPTRGRVSLQGCASVAEMPSARKRRVGAARHSRRFARILLRWPMAQTRNRRPGCSILAWGGDGRPQAIYIGHGKDRWKDSYHFLLTMPLGAFFGVMGAGYLAVNALFATLYLVVGGGLGHPTWRLRRRILLFGRDHQHRRLRPDGASEPGRPLRGDVGELRRPVQPGHRHPACCSPASRDRRPELCSRTARW